MIRSTFIIVNLSHVALVQHVSQSCKFYLCNIVGATRAFQLAIMQFKMFCFCFLSFFFGGGGGTTCFVQSDAHNP